MWLRRASPEAACRSHVASEVPDILRMGVPQEDSRRIDELQRQVEWLKQNTVRHDAQLEAALQRLGNEEQERQLKRSQSFYGMFGLSR